MNSCSVKEEMKIWFLITATGNATNIQVPDTAYRYLQKHTGVLISP
jgi:hypothetical protein